MSITAAAGLMIFLVLIAVALAVRIEKHALRSRIHQIEQERHRVLDEVSALRRQAEDEMLRVIHNWRKQ